MSYPVPDAALAHHTILLGKTRAGKSSTMRGMVERLLDQEKPIGIIDPKGDWWGLKSSADGKRAGYPVIIFGGEHADVPINAQSGAHVAELVASGNRPFIIDLGGWMVGERTRFFVDFASAFFRHARGPRHLAIDEVHNFAPQGRVLDPDSGKMLHWANRLASEGAGKGITLISASQRPQKVHKDYVTSHETLIAMRVIHPLDRGAVKEWIDGCPDPEKGKEVMTTLASLERGEGWVWSPEAKFGPILIRFPMFKTYDSFAAPTSDRIEKLKGWASVDLEDVRTKLSTAVEEAKANDPRALKAEIARLGRELAAARKSVAVDLKVNAKPAIEEVSEIRGQLKALEQRAISAEGKLAKIARLAMPATMMVKPGALSDDELRELAMPRPGERIIAAPPREDRGFRVIGATADGDCVVPSGCAKPLAALAGVYPAGMTEPQWALAAGYKRSGGTWGAYKSRLRGAGLIESRDGKFFATAAGAEAVGPVETPPAPGPDLVRWWAARLSGTRPIADALIEAWPHGLSKEDLADRVGMTASGGSFGAYLSRLASPGLITRGAEIRLADEVMGG